MVIKSAGGGAAESIVRRRPRRRSVDAFRLAERMVTGQAVPSNNAGAHAFP